MTTPEMLAALDGMVCLVDSREQDTPRLRRRLKDIGIPHERQKLNVGDYSAKFPMPDGSWVQLPVSLERKMDATELAGCYCQQRARFEREFERARETNTKLYLLIESTSWEEIYSGQYRSHMKPKALVASILAWLARYDCQIIFCEPRTTGKLIHDILYREGKEMLEGMVDE